MTQTHRGAGRDRGGASRHGHALTLADLIHEWHRLHGMTLRDSTTRYTRTLATAYRLGNPSIESFTAHDFARYRVNRLNDVTAATINHEHRYLRAVINECRRMDVWNGANPLQHLRQLRADLPPFRYLTDFECGRLLYEAGRSRNFQLRAMVLLCLSGGLRWIELLRLQPGDVQPGMIHVRNQKSGGVRHVPIPAGVAETVLQVTCLGGRLFDQATDGGKTAFRCAYRRAGIVTPGQQRHILRHTYASHFMMNGGDVLTLQKILGHSDLKLTQRYAHLSPAYLERATTYSPVAANPDWLVT